MRKTKNLLIEKPVELNENHEQADILYIDSFLVKGNSRRGRTFKQSKCCC